MTRPYLGILRRPGALALVAASMVVSLTQTAQASDALPSLVQPQSLASSTTPPAACAAACEAQQALATALREPVRIGDSSLRLGVSPSKLTIGWSLTF
jgi:hypothetical protein